MLTKYYLRYNAYVQNYMYEIILKIPIPKNNVAKHEVFLDNLVEARGASDTSYYREVCLGIYRTDTGSAGPGCRYFGSARHHYL